MPETKKVDETLSLDEIYEVVFAASECDITKYKITGGEPLIRDGIVDFIKKLHTLNNIKDITMTTNGFYLEKLAKDLKKAGLSSVNISLDTLNREKFKQITGVDALNYVLSGIKEAINAGISTKLNTVIQKGVNDDELFDIIELARNDKLNIRFIEMMPIGHGKESTGVSNIEILERIKERYNFADDNKKHGNGPAKYIKLEGFNGSIGFISAIHGKFCDNCNRIRFTSTGKLKPCLCYESNIDVKDILKNTEIGSEKKHSILKEKIRECIAGKPEAHAFEDLSKISEMKDMVEIGG
jgi:possible molybdenum (mo2+) cofactor biosynthesis enzyme